MYFVNVIFWFFGGLTLPAAPRVQNAPSMTALKPLIGYGNRLWKKGFADGFYRMTFPPDGKTLEVEKRGGIFERYRVADGSLTGTWKSKVYADDCVFSPDRTRVAIPIRKDEYALTGFRVRDTRTSRILLTIRRGRQEALSSFVAPSMLFSSDGKRIAAAFDDKTETTIIRVYVWNCVTRKLEKVFQPEGNYTSLQRFAFSDDGTRLVIAQDRNEPGEPVATFTRLTFWNTQTWKRIARLPELEGRTSILGFSGRDIFGVTTIANRFGGDYNLSVWNLRTQKRIVDGSGSVGNNMSAGSPGVFSRNGKRMAVFMAEAVQDDPCNVVTISEVEKKQLPGLVRVAKTVRNVALSSDGSHLAVLEEDGTLTVWHLPARNQTNVAKP